MTKKVERIAPYVQGEALVLSQGPYTFALQRVARGASGELWWLYDETEREANNWAGTISIHDDAGGVLDVGMDGVENPIIRSAHITATFTISVDEEAIKGYLARLLLLLGIQGEVQVYDGARHLGFLLR
jgi:hypothetical protein